MKLFMGERVVGRKGSEYFEELLDMDQDREALTVVEK